MELNSLIGKMEWFKKLGFVENPFYLEPVKLTKLIKEKDFYRIKGFIDRAKESKLLFYSLQERNHKILVISDVGVGKSSFLNLAQIYAHGMNKPIIRINITSKKLKENIFEEILTKFKELDIIDKNLIKLIEGSTQEGIISKSIEGSVKIIKGAMKEEKKAKPLKFKQEIVLNKLLEKYPCVFLFDDVDKLDDDEFREFIRVIFDPIKNTILIGTANTHHIKKEESFRIVQKFFDLSLYLEEIKSTKELKGFIDGRMKDYTFNHRTLKINNDVLNILLKRTKGNLRECFRYLTACLKLFTKINNETIKKAIYAIDKVIKATLDEKDNLALEIVNSKKSIDIDNLYKEYKREFKDSKSALRKRLDVLYQKNLVDKTTGRGYGRRVLYKSLRCD